MSNPVLISDLEARFRPLNPAEQINAQALLDDAWALLLTRRPGLVQHMEEAAVSTAMVRAVVAAMVVRVLRNPEGWATESVDDWSGRRGDSTAAGLLYVDDAELTLLNPGGVGDGAFTIRPSGSLRTYQPDPWVTLP